MAFQIKTNELGFLDAIARITEIIDAWELQNEKLNQELSALEQEWKGTSGTSYSSGSQCISAHSIKNSTELMKLRSYISFTKMQMDMMDMAYAKAFINNIETFVVKQGNQNNNNVAE